MESTHIDGVDCGPPSSGRCLPPEAFTSPAIWAVEMERIFGRSWVHVADLPELDAPGDFAAATIGTTPVVVVRGPDGVVRGFLNACRHRGTKLAVGRGNCGRSLDCPYHAWSYATDGRLLGVPHRDEFDCDWSTMGLVPIRVATLGPLVFGCLDAAAPPFEAWAGELGAAMERARGAAMAPAFEFAYDVDVNWKVYVENGLEGYHIQFVQEGLRARGLPPGVHSSFLEVRIGHFERMVSRALAAPA